MDKISCSLNTAFEQFLAEKELFCTRKTVAGYRSAVGLFVSSAKDVDMDAEPMRRAIIDYLGSKREAVSDYSLFTYWNTLRVFSRWLASEGLVEPFTLPTLKPPQNVIRPYSPDQIRGVIESQPPTFLGLRDASMVRLVYDTGIRLGEISTIERTSIDLQKGLLVVYGKGRKERWVPFGRKTTAALWKYTKARDRIATGCALFVTSGGRDMAYGGINMAFRRMGLKPHTIRHSFALQWVESEGSEKALQKILGHTTLAMTHHYVAMATTTIKSQHERHSPGDRI